VLETGRAGSCRLELAFSFMRTEPRRARESRVGPLAAAFDHRTGGPVCAICPRVPLAERRSAQDEDQTRGVDQGLTGATRQSKRHVPSIRIDRRRSP
jgi:hypothetical protein